MNEKLDTIKDSREMLHSYDDGSKAVEKLLNLAQREVLFFSYDLQPRMVNTKSISDAMLGILKRSRKASIKTLLSYNTLIKRDGHRWLEIARRFTSNIEIKKPRKEDLSLVHVYLLVDGQALLYKPYADHYEGYYSLKAPNEVKALRKQFLEAWNVATPEPEVNRLHL